jgi:hypothetical protein
MAAGLLKHRATDRLRALGCWALVLVATAVLAVVPLRARDAFAAGGCGFARATVVKASAAAVVVRVRNTHWACLRNSRRGVRLDRYDDWELEEVALAGRFVAVSRVGCLAECAEESEVAVYDLRKRRAVRSVFPVRGFVVKVLVATRGGVVFVEEASVRRIRAKDSRRGVQNVDSAPRSQLPLGAVRLHGNLLRWRHGGVEHSYRLR